MSSLEAALATSLAVSIALCVPTAWACRSSRLSGSLCSSAPLGGIAAWLAIVAGILTCRVPAPSHILFALIATGSALLCLGIAAERLTLIRGRLLRWASAIAAAIALAASGILTESATIASGEPIALGKAAVPLSAAWMAVVILLVLLTNRGEGLVSGVGAISGIALFIISGLAAKHSVSAEAGRHLCLAMAGALAPYTLAALATPAFRFGGGASLAIGAVLAAVTVLGQIKEASLFVLVIPALALGAPMTGTFLAWMASRRIGQRRLRPDRQWPSFLELFVERGMRPTQAVAFLLCWHAYLCTGAIAMGLLLGLTSPWVRILLLSALLFGGGVMFYVTFQVTYGGKRPLPERKEPGARDQVRILDVAVDRLSVEETLACVAEFIESRTYHLIVTIDAGGILRARTDPEFRQIVSGAALVTPDGAGVVLGARLLDEPFHERVSGCDLIFHICRLAADRGHSVYLLGARPGVALEAADALKGKLPSLNIAGVMHGYFDEEEEREVVRAIACARPDVLFVALGSPAQEKWIARHAHELYVPVCMGVGGSFDVISGRVRRAPEWVRRMWCEFLWRSLSDPRRVGRLLLVVRFLIALALDAPRRLRRGS